MIKHYLQLLGYYRRLVFWIVLSSTLGTAAMCTAWLIAMPSYTSSTSLVMLPSDAQLTFSKGNTVGLSSVQSLSETHVEYLKSRPVVEDVLDVLLESAHISAEPKAPEGFVEELVVSAKLAWGGVWRAYRILNTGHFVEPDPRHVALDMLGDGIEIEQIPGSYILKISCTLPFPKASKEAANALAQTYLRRVNEELETSAASWEDFLEKQIVARETELAELAGSPVDLRQIPARRERKGALEAELGALRLQKLDVGLTRASAVGQVRIIEPAVEPIYPSSPKVLNYTVLGFIASVLLALFIVVAIDTLSETIKTSADLHRVSGGRDLGLISHSVRNVPRWRRSLWRRNAKLKSLGSQLERAISIQTHSGSSSVRVTGLLESDELIDATVTMAAAFGACGRDVVCRLPVTPKHVAKVVGDLIHFEDPGTADMSASHSVQVDCLDPVASGFNWEAANEAEELLVFVIPSGRVSEKEFANLRARALESGCVNLSFLLIEG